MICCLRYILRNHAIGCQFTESRQVSLYLRCQPVFSQIENVFRNEIVQSVYPINRVVHCLTDMDGIVVFIRTFNWNYSQGYSPLLIGYQRYGYGTDRLFYKTSFRIKQIEHIIAGITKQIAFSHAKKIAMKITVAFTVIHGKGCCIQIIAFIVKMQYFSTGNHDILIFIIDPQFTYICKFLRTGTFPSYGADKFPFAIEKINSLSMQIPCNNILVIEIVANPVTYQALVRCFQRNIFNRFYQIRHP